MTKVLNYRVIVEQDEDGVFVASAPSLQGCYTEGDTFEEAINNIKDVIKLHIGSRKETGIISDNFGSGFLGITNVSINYGIPANS